MKTLIIVRHAKSDWENESIDDILRPLNKRGYNDAKILSAELAKKIKIPALWVSSPAIRAYTTAHIYARAMNYNMQHIRIEPKIYEASQDALLQTISAFSDKYHEAIIFGHNPGFTNLFNTLSTQFADNLPTCATMVLTANVDKWSTFVETKANCNFYLYPKEFNA